MSPSTRRAPWRQWPAVLVLAAIWVLLWGSLSWGTALLGLAVAVAVVWFLPLPRVATSWTIRPWGLCVLVGRFGADLVVASFQVAWLALRPGPGPRGGVVGVRLTHPGTTHQVVTAELASLVPGSVVVELRPHDRTVYLHVLDLALAGGTDGVRRDIRALEARVLRAFPPKKES
ncbi:Na+/H+ antiporter subunit E [Antribacter sp. KLBMP9083]|uniref:Na+/H+ antiporter subunit E n=1 Tax=Antribacter soli TaxID=2910976 RepID=A0AA41QHH8_9MICO|nr:Na+/H+ antiporter subunit E [Antribacter soli]MCF4123588.1 Na+/H+ antiporter subunit E [Antribacter soli]